MREYVWLECTVCGARNYRTEKETRGAERLALKKFCRKERKHTSHKESRKKYCSVFSVQFSVTLAWGERDRRNRSSILH
jgi:large subunit ribosomal protein L33